jgi:cyclopropane-fatty-acyl-phospholipid synthase
MNPRAAMAIAAERLPLPDRVTRAGIAVLVDRMSRRLQHVEPGAQDAFAQAMADRPIAEHTADANAQHYELPPEFFARILGPQRKYSCCLYDGVASLDQAEERALAETALHAELADGQRILELGCGWGSLTLWMARQYPAAHIVAVSNSRSQGGFIRAEAARLGLDNIRVVTDDVNSFEAGARFDRIVSVEMFEHVSNWVALLDRVHGWLLPQGRLFLHVFSHCAMPYRFDHADKGDWIARHFFTGGIMPSHGLLRQLPCAFTIEGEWRWSGAHYRRTAEDWLANFDRQTAAVNAVLRAVYGAEATLWRRRWRLFFLATAGLFGARDGAEWGISHYRLQPR